MALGTLMRYWHTVRYLRLQQVIGRIRYRLQRPEVDLSPAPPLAVAGDGWARPAKRPPSLVDATTFSFLGEQAGLDRIGWDGPQMGKLWRYNQHYFDDLNAAGACSRATWHESLIADWIHNNAPGTGNAWEPYPTSLRIVNWAKWRQSGGNLSAVAIQSLAVQARWLVKRLEWHLLGNHLFANAKALIFAGLTFRSDEAEAWLKQGLAIVDRELPEQVLSDGGNFERSPMYHAIFVEDLLDLVNIGRASHGRVGSAQLGRWEGAIVTMLDWLKGMLHPDGEISFFNDAAIGIAPTYSELEDYARRLNIPFSEQVKPALPTCQVWSDSGYVRLEGENAVAILDVAPVGPDYLPGHAHADTLSFELSLFGSRVVVNGGTSRYGLGPDRERERATCSHSTVEVNGMSSSVVWSGFRVAQRAYPFAFSSTVDSDVAKVTCSHDGYRRLPGKPVHRRAWSMYRNYLDVSDHVDGDHHAIARYILHPSVEVISQSGEKWQLAVANGKRIDFEILGGTGRIEPASYAHGFGDVTQTSCIAVELVKQSAAVRISWS